MRVIGLLLAVTATTVICATATGADARPALSTAAAQPVGATTQDGFWIPFWMRTLGRRFLNRKVRIGETPKEVAKHALTEWIQSRGEICSVLPARYFCPARPQIVTRWGIGYALQWNGRSPGAWSWPRSPRTIRFILTPGYAFWLTCYTYGDLVTDGGIRTTLWYRLTNGTYVNDGWVETGTNAPISGMSHC